MVGFRRKDKSGIATFMGQGTRVEGLLSFEGTVRVDGELEGQVQSETGTLIIGKSARIQGEIAVNHAVVMGEVHGTLQAHQSVDIRALARMYGDIRAPVVSVDPGATVYGNCQVEPPTGAENRRKPGEKPADPPGNGRNDP